MITTLSRRIAPIAVLATGLGSAALALAPAAHADTSTVTYLYSGAEQTFTVPTGVNGVHVVAIGGRGGSSLGCNSSDPEAGGRGGTASAELPHRLNPLPGTQEG